MGCSRRPRHNIYFLTQARPSWGSGRRLAPPPGPLPGHARARARIPRRVRVYSHGCAADRQLRAAKAGAGWHGLSRSARPSLCPDQKKRRRNSACLCASAARVTLCGTECSVHCCSCASPCSLTQTSRWGTLVVGTAVACARAMAVVEFLQRETEHQDFICCSKPAHGRMNRHLPRPRTAPQPCRPTQAALHPRPRPNASCMRRQT